LLVDEVGFAVERIHKRVDGEDPENKNAEYCHTQRRLSQCVALERRQLFQKERQHDVDNGECDDSAICLDKAGTVLNPQKKTKKKE
jgi:hypothetical protein